MKRLLGVKGSHGRYHSMCLQSQKFWVESSRVEGRVEIGFKKIVLEYSDLRGILSSIFGRVKSSFTQLVPYTRLVEGMDTLSSTRKKIVSNLALPKKLAHVWLNCCFLPLFSVFIVLLFVPLVNEIISLSIKFDSLPQTASAPT